MLNNPFLIKVACGHGTTSCVFFHIILFIELTAFLLLCVSIADSAILRHNSALVVPSEGGSLCLCPFACNLCFLLVVYWYVNHTTSIQYYRLLKTYNDCRPCGHTFLSSLQLPTLAVLSCLVPTRIAAPTPLLLPRMPDITLVAVYIHLSLHA